LGLFDGDVLSALATWAILTGYRDTQASVRPKVRTIPQSRWSLSCSLCCS